MFHLMFWRLLKELQLNIWKYCFAFLPWAKFNPLQNSPYLQNSFIICTYSDTEQFGGHVAHMKIWERLINTPAFQVLWHTDRRSSVALETRSNWLAFHLKMIKKTFMRFIFQHLISCVLLHELILLVQNHGRKMIKGIHTQIVNLTI